MESLGAVGMGSYAGPAAQRRQPLNARNPYADMPVGNAGRTQPGGLGQQGGTAFVGQVGYHAHTRRNITQIFFGCQNVMIYAAEGHVELLLSMDPSGSWQPLTPDAAEELGQRLLDAAHRARATAGHEVPE